MRLKYKETVNKYITNKIDLGEIVYTNEKIIDSNHIENSLYDVYERPSVYKQVAPNFNITKGDNGLALANFKISYNGDHAPIAEVSCNYNYYKLFEKDVCYIYDAKGMLCLYDERKALIGVIAKVVNR